MSTLFKKKVGNVYTDNPVADFFASCALIIFFGFIVWAMLAG